MQQYSLLLPEIILAGLGLLLLALDLTVSSKRTLAVAGVIGTLATLAAVVANFGAPATEIWSGTIRVDAFAQYFKLIFAVILGLVFLFSGEYLERREVKVGEFYILVTFATLGAFLMASSLELITIYIGLELMTISSYVLAGMLRNDARSSEASIKFFLMGALTSGVILYGLSLLYGLTGSTHLAEIAAGLAASPNASLITAAGVFIIAGFGFKIAAVPFHMWAPDTYEGAPTPVSAFLITASEAAGFAALLRILLVGLAPALPQWQAVLAVIAFVTMTFGNVTAIVQTRTKRMLAYSAIAQAGYVLVGVAVATPESVSAMLFYLMVYAFSTIGAFAVVIMLSNHVPSEEIEDFKGLARRAPAFALSMAFLLLSLIGVPPTGGFFGKLSLYRAAVDGGMVWLALAMVLNSAISVPYYFNVIRNMYLAEGPSTALGARPGLKIALGISVAATLLLGVFPEPLVGLLRTLHIMP
ncbi:MAG: NADH-quinone oxidoreductase subunit N [Clostridia bacterium]|nr:NADH-quinone oxidoreductase subunit N [Bacillota bacterium]MBO2520516.1 NADH-quinone oxidoreductase subunit N [Bacillota bacterium]